MVVEVTCAIIEQEAKVLAVQKGSKSTMPNKWEFAGGKVEPNETYEDCIVREIKEELNIAIDILEKLPFCDVSDKEQTIRLIPFVCAMRKGEEIKLVEHKALKWLTPNGFNTIDWALADLKVIKNYLKFIAARK